MNNKEIKKFIEWMGEMGDIWTEEQVKDVYGNTSLEEALKDRESSVGHLVDIVNKILNK